MGHIWNYIKPREILVQHYGLAKYNECWVCEKCGANSSDVDKFLSWLPEDKPPNEVLIETYDGNRNKLSCDELMTLRIHSE